MLVRTPLEFLYGLRISVTKEQLCIPDITIGPAETGTQHLVLARPVLYLLYHRIYRNN